MWNVKLGCLVKVQLSSFINHIWKRKMRVVHKLAITPATAG